MRAVGGDRRGAVRGVRGGGGGDRLERFARLGGDESHRGDEIVEGESLVRAPAAPSEDDGGGGGRVTARERGESAVAQTDELREGHAVGVRARTVGVEVVARERVEILEGLDGMPAGMGWEGGAARRAVEERAAERLDEIVVRRGDVAVAEVQVGGEVGAVQVVDDAGVWGGGVGDGRRGGMRRWGEGKRAGRVPPRVGEREGGGAGGGRRG